MATVNNKKLRVVVAWLWCSALALTAQDGNAAALRFEKVTFKVTSTTTADDFTKFIIDVRNQALTAGVINNGIPVLRDPSRTPVSDPQRFFLVELSNDRGGTITLAIDVTNMYIIGYEAAGNSFFFSDAPGNSAQYLFTDTVQQTFAFGSRYGDLAGQPGGGQRDSIQLGHEEFMSAISNLRYGTSIGNAFIVLIQMIAEAARFRVIETRVRNAFATGESFMPDAYMVDLENSWSPHSTQVQESTEGVFQRPVRVQTATGDNFVEYDNVRQVIANLALMLFICTSRPSIEEYPMLIRPAVAKTDLIRDDICTVSEPTVHISGPDGLCVDVRGETYENGNPVQLWPCHGGENQLWDIKSDGTIRSAGMCLTTYGYSPGSYVMIYDCDSAAVAATKWEIWQNGTIFNPESGLVLNADSGAQGTTLTVDTNTYASKQSWLPTRDTNPLIVSIIGFRSLCMQANGAAMWLETCESGKEEQKWALYPDDTIRPTQRRDQCLMCDSDSAFTIITIGSCSSGGSGQRWVFTNEGTILNLHNGLVMDVNNSEPSLHQIIMFPFTGSQNQLWVPQP